MAPPKSAWLLVKVQSRTSRLNLPSRIAAPRVAVLLLNSQFCASTFLA